VHRRGLRNLASGLKPIYSDNAWLGKVHGRDLRRIEEYSFHWFKYGVPRAAWSFQLGTSPRTTDYRRFDTKLGQDAISVEVVNFMSRSSTTNWRGVICGALSGVMALWMSPPLSAQELEIRRWNHLPINQNFVTANFARTDGDIAIDPVLRIENASVELDTWLFGYIRTFELLDRTARVEVRQAWQDGTWDGVVDGIPTTITRKGASDTFARFAVNLVGPPPLAGKAYADYRAATDVETIVGAALSMQLPTGQYLEDKLINLGGNRFTFSPQLGVRQQYYNWSFEATGMARLHTDNTSFFNGMRRQQDPSYTATGNVEYKFQSGIWASAGAGIAVGGQSTVNGVEKDDRREDFGWSVSAGFPVARSLGFRATYFETDHWAKVGIASQTMSVGLVGWW
jgi:hypothetical protein